MPLIIDTYNLLHAALGPAGKGRDLGIAGLTALIKQSRYASQPTTLVCDGTRKTLASMKSSGVRIVFAGSERDADTLLEQFIARDTAPARLVVVSSDRRVQTAARRRRCQILSSESFLSQLLRDASSAAAQPRMPDPRARIPLGNAEVQHWVAYFGPDAVGAHLPPPEPALPAPPAAATPERLAPEPPPPKSHTPRASPPRVEPVRPRPPDPRHDPLLAEAIDHFPGMSWDDLDMDRWLRGESLD